MQRVTVVRHHKQKRCAALTLALVYKGQNKSLSTRDVQHWIQNVMKSRLQESFCCTPTSHYGTSTNTTKNTFVLCRNQQQMCQLSNNHISENSSSYNFQFHIKVKKDTKTSLWTLQCCTHYAHKPINTPILSNYVYKQWRLKKSKCI